MKTPEARLARIVTSSAVGRNGMKQLTQKAEARLAGIVTSVGTSAREKIRTLPKDQQDLAWATVAAAVASAAIHDAEDREKVFGFIIDTVTTLQELMQGGKE